MPTAAAARTPTESPSEDGYGLGVDVEIRLLDDRREERRLHDVLDQVWGTTSVVSMEVIRAVAHAGGYVAAAYADGQLVGGSLGFLGRHRGEPSLHSHVTGILPGVRGTGLGRALKLHQRAWAAANGLAWITWTFDPLVRHNAWFNLGVLGAAVEEYLVDFYGPIEDAVNAGDESDRLLVAWAVGDGTPTAPPDVDSAGTLAVATPPDVVVLRRTDPAAANAWRRRVRGELGGALAAGAVVRGFTREGDYLVAAGSAP
jgi:predicted GNAT superfamily acetyltransferase